MHDVALTWDDVYDVNTSRKFGPIYGDVFGIVGEPTVVPSIYFDIHGEDFFIREESDATSIFVF